MSQSLPNDQSLLAENAALRVRLDKAEAMLRASGVRETDALVAEGDADPRHEAEVAQRRNEALFSTIIEQAPGGVYVVDAQFRVAAMNAETRPYFAAVQPLIGHDFDEALEIVWGPEVGPQIATIFRHTLSTGERYVSPRFSEQRHDIGVEQAFQWETQRITLSDGQPGVVCYFQEITARERAEAALRDSEERLRLAIVGSDLGTWHWDLRTGALEWSERCLTIFGIPLGTAMTYETFLGALHPDDRARADEAVRSALQDGAEYRIECRTVWPDGSEHWAVSLGRAYTDADGAATRLEGIAFDITERKRVEMALLESERNYRALATATSEVAYRMSADWSKMLPLDGRDVVASSDASLVEWAWLNQNIPTDEHPRVRRAISEAVATQALFELEHRVRDSNGSVGWTLSRAVPILDANGTVTAWFGTASNITDRRNAQEALSASEARNAFLVMLADTLRPLSDPVTIQVEASRVLGERLGANRVAYFEVHGDDFIVLRDYTSAVPSIVGSHPVASFAPAILAVLRTGRTSAERDVHGQPITPDEQAVFAHLQVRAYITVPLIKDGQFVAGLSVHTDTVRTWSAAELAMAEDTAERTWAAVERARAESALRESEARLSGILRHSPVGIVETDAHGAMTLVNPCWCEMLGRAEAELLGRTILDFTHPACVDATATAFRGVASGGPDIVIELDYCRKDGSVLHAQSHVTAILSPAGELVGMIAVVLDVSARLRAEAELRRLAANLSEVDRRKDVFLATLAHELRNPLAPIRNGLQIMELAEADTGMVEKTRSMMERQVEHMTRLIDDLMDVSRISLGKIQLRTATMSLADAVQSAVESSRALIEVQGHELVVDVPLEPIYVEGDVARLSQVFANLLNNAAKYTGRGGRIRLAVEQQEIDAVVSVDDNGDGIAADKLSHVFDMFTQIDGSLEKSHGGLGLGLYIVKRLVELHDGSIIVESGGYGAGSRFVVRLPAALAPGTNGAVDHKHEPRSTPVRRRILVVDDNHDVATSLAELLHVMGNNTKTAFDGEQALIIAEAFRPDVIVMDIGMPKLNGYDACRRIRSEPWGQNIVIIAQSGWGQEDQVRMSQEAGFTSHLVKPVDPVALNTLLAGLPAPMV
ncbi:PAS domain S-box protein [Gemmatimonas groenlandica]|uniref:histidine kinase n=1 Tax=Gemmatimonas groenlandica TaxID=2732249 RepID=A0A6M4IMN4_9BACT|nr:PAS domain S-box protein [Gemmatimonas groenlandica]QJR34272.1 PAS domain S-box protein [Gemmatimonas groenlandica]